jgi:hypothetical protein
MSTPDTEGLISHLSGPLLPSDRPLFRHDAEVALAAPACWGDGLIYRTVVPIWRHYFVPPPDQLSTPRRQHRSSKLIDQPPIGSSSRSDEL